MPGLYRRPPQPQPTQPRRLLGPLSPPPPAGQCYFDTVIADSPVAYFRFGEPSGTNANNEIGSLDGTYQASPTLGVTGALSGDSNTAVTLAASSFQYVSVPDDTSLDLGDVFSLEVWCKKASGADTTERMLFSKGQNGYALDYSLGGDRLLALNADNAAIIVKSTTAITDTNWHHVVATKDGATVALYLDGVDVTGSVSNTTIVNTTTELRIGFANVGGANWWDGSLDEPALYSVALSAAQVLDHYNAAPVSCGGGTTVNVTASDSVATTESVDRVVTNLRTSADSVTVGNSVARTVTNLRTASDSLGIADSVARVVTNNGTAADTLTIADSVARTVTLARTASDAVGVSDAVTRTVTNLRTAADSLTISESVSRTIASVSGFPWAQFDHESFVVDQNVPEPDLAVEFATQASQAIDRTASDSVSVSDSVSRTVTNNRTAADSISIGQTVDGIKVVPRSLSDSIAVGNAVTRTVTNLRTASDSVGVAESVARTVTLPRTASDSVSVGNTVARVVTLFRTASDSVGIANTVARVATNLRSAADALTIGNTVARVATNLRTASDSIGISESVAGIKVVPRSVADSLTIGDAVTRTVTLFRTAADAVGISESVSRVTTALRTAADTLFITESVDAQESTHLVTVTADDSFVISDTATRQVTNNRTATDNVGIAESVSRTIIKNRTASDSLGIADSVARAVTLPRTNADSVSVAEDVVRVLTSRRTAADGVTISETVVQASSTSATAADSVTVADAVTRQLTLFRAASDSIAITDEVTIVKNGVPIVPAGAGHKGPTFLGRLPERRPRKQPRTVRVPVTLSLDVADTLRLRTSVNAVVEFDDDEEALALLMLVGAR